MMMKRYVTTLMFVLATASSAWATPTDALVRNLSSSVLRVTVNLPDGKQGLGSAVVIAKNEVITNCHVVTNASDVSIVVNGEPHKATAIKADWHHDLCMLTVDNLDVPAVKLGASRALRYEESIFTIGYPDEVKAPVSTFGVVKGLFPMDDSVVTTVIWLGLSL
jgi:serine protease Do